MFMPGYNLWQRLRLFFGLTTTDLAIQPPVAGGKVRVIQGGVAATGTNEAQISHNGTITQFLNPAGTGSTQSFSFGSAGSQGFIYSYGGIGTNGSLTAGTNVNIVNFGGTIGAGGGQLVFNNGYVSCGTGTWLQNTAGDHRVTADVTNATTTFSNITDLTTTYIAGRKYVAGRMRIDTLNATAGDGVKLDLNGGSANWTNITIRYKIYDTSIAAPIASGKTTSIATAITAATVTGTAWAEIEYCGVLNAAGTLIPRYAKNSDAAGALLTVKLNGEHTVKDCPN